MQEKMNNEQVKKTFKPVPDVECLKYHGTPEKPDIKIFVSHRIDKDSETIDNPLYIPVRCGAVYDDRENVAMLGDDTGDNISEKRESFCELTVMYWAWKNVKADYYGLCHYRRYLSFSEEEFEISHEGNTSGLVEINTINEATQTFKLNNDIFMRSIIENNDIISINQFDEKMAHSTTMYEMICDDFINYDKNVVDALIEIIKNQHPKIFPIAEKYFAGSNTRLFNLFVVRKEIYFDFCEFMFSVLFYLEKEIDLQNESKNKQRQIGYMGEHLWAIYLMYLESQRKFKINERQGVFVNYVQPIEDIKPAFQEKNISVVFACSDSFVPYLGVALKSLVDSSNSNNNYDVVILERNISDFQKDRINTIVVEKKNFCVRFVNVSYIVKNIHFFLANNNDLSEETYYTVLVPWVLKNYEKSLVLDCDIIIKRDVADLFKIDMNSYYLAAAKEIIYLGFLNNPLVNVNDSLMKYTKKTLGLENPYDYFQAGVMLMNLDKLRSDFNLKSLLQDINENKYNVVEQDLLNKICAGKVLILPYNWNFMACISDSTIPNLELAPSYEYEKYELAAKDPYIYHYITIMKPWRYPNLKYAEEWWYVARKTIFYEVALSNLRITSVPIIERAIYDLQRDMGYFDNRSRARKCADKLLPKGTKRREFAKKIVPRGSRRWNFCKKIYYFFNPSKKQR